MILEKNVKLFDLHCDTLTEIYRRGEKMSENSCHISFDKAFTSLDEYCQVLAVWSDNKLNGEENFSQFKKILDYSSPLLKHEKFKFFLAVEGGELLCGDLSRLRFLRDSGVRILTLVWKGDCCIGGAYDTHNGLTPFGKEVLRQCFELGIVPDVSHSSDELFYDTAEFAAKHGGTIIASHSCSREVFSHPRNISDDMARIIAELGGVVGVNLVVEHLGGTSISDVTKHIDHFINVIGEDKVCLGCDFDGTDILPCGINNVGDLVNLYESLCQNKYQVGFADKVFYSNAQNFFKNHLF